MSQRGPDTVLVTGAMGFIGAWVVRRLLDDGDAVVTYDTAGDDYRLRYLMSEDELAGLTRLTGDIADAGALRAAVSGHGITRAIHLAALQVPFCAADPLAGALANVVGTVNLFEALAESPAAGAPLAYASSVAAFGGDDDGLHEASGTPSTHYGVFKRANEGNAAVYWKDSGRPSIGLRPYVVYGPGRDRGVTSEPTVAMLRAARGEGHHIPFGGRSHMQYAGDVAAAFVAAARSDLKGAEVFNLGGSVVDMGEIVREIERAVPEVTGKVTYDDTPLPFPPEVATSEFERHIGPVPDTSLEEGVGQTVRLFRRLIEEGRLPAPS